MEGKSTSIPPDCENLNTQPRWREDFPIDIPQDNYHARREFTKFLVLTSLAFVVGQFWIALRNLWRKSQGTPPVSRIAALDDLPVGGVVSFHYPSQNDPALLIRTANGLIAFASQCTHLQCPVVPQFELGRLHCPCHVGYFDLATGKPLAGPPRRPLRQIRLEVRNKSVFAVEIEEGST